jgi:hypothetical protein
LTYDTNQMSAVDFNLFQGSNALKSIDFHDNPIVKTMSSSTFKSNVQITCDCVITDCVSLLFDIKIISYFQ